MELRHGGKLEIGDLVAVSNGNYISFGFYAGTGRGTLQYWWIRQPANAYNNYQDWLKLPEDKRSRWTNKRFEKGFTTKCIYKSYINAVHDTRVIKITNPEDIFTKTEDRESYEKSKEVLITLNILKK